MAIITGYHIGANVWARAEHRYLGYLEYRSDQSEIWRDDASGYLQQSRLGDKGLVDFCQFPMLLIIPRGAYSRQKPEEKMP